MPKTPLRRCIGCGNVKNKAELMRFVKAKDGKFLPDKDGCLQGRGFYLCCDAGCLKRAAKNKSVSESLYIQLEKEYIVESSN